MKVAKVVNIYTREEVTEMPYSVENAQDIIAFLMEYKNPRTGAPITEDEYKIIDHLFRMLENNSGTFREDAFGHTGA